MGIVGSLLRRLGTGDGRRGRKPISRREEEEEEREVMRAAAKGFKETAFSHVHAKKWKEAALAFGEQAACDLKRLRFYVPLNPMLGSTKKACRPLPAHEGSVAATKLALDQALALFVKLNDLLMAAVSCAEVAEMYVEQRELQAAMEFFEKAAGYYGSNRNSRHYRYEADRIRFLLARKETYHRLPKTELRAQMYEVLATGIM
nr:unnamed protein product [Digitaria exilis]